MVLEQYTHEHLDHDQHNCGPDCALHGEQAQAFVDDLFGDSELIDQATQRQPYEATQTSQDEEVKQSHNTNESHNPDNHKCGPDCALHGEQAQAFVDDLFADAELTKNKSTNQPEQTTQQVPEQEHTSQDPQEIIIKKMRDVEQQIETFEQVEKISSPINSEAMQRVQRQVYENSRDLEPETVKTFKVSEDTLNNAVANNTDVQQFEEVVRPAVPSETTYKQAAVSAEAVTIDTGLAQEFTEPLPADAFIPLTEPVHQEHGPQPYQETVLQESLLEAETIIEESPSLAEADFHATQDESEAPILEKLELQPLEFPYESPESEFHTQTTENTFAVELLEPELLQESVHIDLRPEITPELNRDLSTFTAETELAATVEPLQPENIPETVSTARQIELVELDPGATEQTKFIDLPSNLERVIVELETTEHKNVKIFLKTIEASGLNLDKNSLERLQVAYLKGDKESLRELLLGYWRLKNQDYLQEFLQNQQFVLPINVNEDIFARVVSLLRRLRNVAA